MSTKSVSDLKKSSHGRVQSEHKVRSFYRFGMASDDGDVMPRFTIDSETDRQTVQSFKCPRYRVNRTPFTSRNRGQSGCHNSFSSQC